METKLIIGKVYNITRETHLGKVNEIYLRYDGVVNIPVDQFQRKMFHKFHYIEMVSEAPALHETLVPVESLISYTEAK